jgi:hypothetical protein
MAAAGTPATASSRAKIRGSGLAAPAAAVSIAARKWRPRPDPPDAGVAVRDRVQRQARGEPRQRVRHLGERHDLVARRQEHAERALRGRVVVAAGAGRAPERLGAHEAEFMGALRPLRGDREPQPRQARGVEPAGDRGAVGREPLAQHRLGARQHRRRIPQRVVEVERNGAQRARHSGIIPVPP